MSVYNTERYIDEAIWSLLNQSIPFSQHVQLILVNDASTDHSEEICLRYRELYPNNIFYYHQPHGGLSSARNTGLKHVKGKYVNFLDPDDKLDPYALEHVLEFFTLHYDLIDMVAIRIQYFDALSDYHALDYKFRKTRIVDLDKEYDCIQLSVATAFFKAEAICTYTFDTSISLGDDAKVTNTLLLEKKKFGVVREAVYFYRKRFDGTSLVQQSTSGYSYYTTVPQNYLWYLVNTAKQRFGYVPFFIQYVVMYDLQWRIRLQRGQALSVLTEDEYNQYCKNLIALLREIDDEVILKQRSLSTRLKLFCISQKEGRDIRRSLNYIDGSIYYNNHLIVNLRRASCITWTFLYVKGDYLYLEGRDFAILPYEDYSYCIQVFGNYYYPQYDNYPKYDVVSVFGVVQIGRIVHFHIPLQRVSISMIQLYIHYQGSEDKVRWIMGRFAHLSMVPFQYYATNNHMLTFVDGSLIVKRYSALTHFHYELEYWKYLYRTNSTSIIAFRSLYWLLSCLKHNVWIVTDRPNRADDNGEHFFRFLNNVPHSKVNSYFILRSDSSDYSRLCLLGHVLPYNSFWHKMYFLLSSCIISSSSNRWVDNAFGDDRKYLCDLYRFRYVFLQHGIIYNDVSSALHKFNRAIDLFITSAEEEYRSILTLPYGYDENVVCLTGLPRHDRLLQLRTEHQIEKMILILPTWRASLGSSHTKITYESVYSTSFKQSQYYHFFNTLINNSSLIYTMKRYGYKGILSLHPSLQTQWIDFQANDVFTINNGSIDYQTLFTKAAVMVTDYSSVFFDFAYMRKPIIYSQFDLTVFRRTQYPAGYFDYVKNGFGPVCYDVECTVQQISDLILKNCSLDPLYASRVESFYAYYDGQNCNRVLQSILNLEYSSRISFLPSILTWALLILILARSQWHRFFRCCNKYYRMTYGQRAKKQS